MNRSKSIITQLLDSAGVVINGEHPWDIKVRNENFFPLVIQQGSLAIGESYMQNWWSSPQPDAFIAKVLSARLDEKIHKSLSLKKHIFLAKLFNHQGHIQAFKNGSRHYDIGNDLFERMLDKRMTYTCAFWDGVKTLDAAQEQKLDISCQKVHLKPGMHVLDIGCGWGSFAQFAAERYDVKVTGITISKEQAALAKDRCKGLPVVIKLMDYRDLAGQYDAIVSLGMFEHVGYKNYRAYMEIARKSLHDGGLFLLHTIGSNRSSVFTDPWIHKYIFPNSMLPSIGQIGKAIEGLFVMEHWENYSADYDKTLMTWYHNFKEHWNELASKYDETFFRMWEYYLLSCAATFRARNSQLWQVVLSKNGVPGGYRFERHTTKKDSIMY